jgi:alkaline phosphatase
VIKGIKASSRVMAQSLINSQTPLKTWYQLTNIELDKAETTKLIATINAVKSLDKTDEAQLTLKTEQLEWHLKTLINNKSNTGWTTTGHTAIDVPVFAYGNGFESFYGYMDNTDIAKKLISLIQNPD